jgi:hypothetical protein
MALKGAGLLESARTYSAPAGGEEGAAVQQLRRRAEQALTESDQLFSTADSSAGAQGAGASAFNKAARDYARTVREMASAGAGSKADSCLTNLGVCDVLSAYALRQAAMSMPDGSVAEAIRRHAREMDLQGRAALGMAAPDGSPAVAGIRPTGGVVPATADPSLVRTRGQAGVDSQGNAGPGVETIGVVGSGAIAKPDDLRMQARQVVQALDALSAGVEEGPASPDAIRQTPASPPSGSGLETGFGGPGGAAVRP